mmetsp:Transcript_3250/g.6066  ORF Transcript_3250/g.6066 Transcript_3250/m.6066 type:complete len:93 (+) Transcript_3250:262-540(+)
MQTQPLYDTTPTPTQTVPSRDVPQSTLEQLGGERTEVEGHGAGPDHPPDANRCVSPGASREAVEGDGVSSSVSVLTPVRRRMNIRALCSSSP